MDQHDRPRRLSQGISTQQAADETLVYDERRHLAFCLNRTSSAVWARLDGANTVEEIAAALQSESAQPVTEEMVALALAQMAENGLLESQAPQFSEAIPATFEPISRRRMMTRLAYGAAVLLPAIAMIAAPKPAQAYNGSVDDQPIPIDQPSQ